MRIDSERLIYYRSEKYNLGLWEFAFIWYRDNETKSTVQGTNGANSQTVPCFTLSICDRTFALEIVKDRIRKSCYEME